MTQYADYRHDATRKNNPSAAFASQGRVNDMPKTPYSYDPHLPPALRFDDSGESDRLPELLADATRRPLTPSEARTVADALANRQPWLEWTGKREKRGFEVDPVALHTHERVSALAAIKIAARQDVQRGLWADPAQSYREAVQFYKHEVPWANRLILGDSLAAMSSLTVREDMAGKVQMIYVDPPYGINYRSNFQPLVGSHNVDAGNREGDLTREPEMVKAYRDTWNLGIHTYLAYLRDRLTVARDLLADSGSIFLQTNDEHVARIRMIMDEVFGADNFVSQITYKVTSGFERNLGPRRIDNHIVWYAKKKEDCKFHRIYKTKDLEELNLSLYRQIEEDGVPRTLTSEERRNPERIPESARVFRTIPLHTMGTAKREPRMFQGREYTPPPNAQWRHTDSLFDAMCKSERIIREGNRIRSKLYVDDFAHEEFNNVWTDTGPELSKVFTVQTSPKVIERCMLMTTDPGDLVLDPTCGSGTTAYIAEQWGRRWITIDTSRVAIALARQRLLTAKFDYYETAAGDGTPSDGFEYETAPRITMQKLGQNTSALDPIFAKWDAVLDEKLASLNAALSDVDADTRAALRAKLGSRGGGGGEKCARFGLGRAALESSRRRLGALASPIRRR